MRYKYEFFRDDPHNRLVIEELACNMAENYTHTGKHVFPSEKIELAIPLGMEEVINALRSDRFFPPIQVAQTMAEMAVYLYTKGRNETDTGTVDEIDIPVEEPKPLPPEETDEDGDNPSDEDALLEEDFEDNDQILPKDINLEEVSIKIQDDDNSGVEIDS